MKTTLAQMQIAPLSLVRMIWKRKIAVLLIWCIVAAGTLTVVSRIPSLYRAEALIVVNSQKIPEKFVAASVNTDIQDQLATITQEVLSSRRLEKLIEDLNLYPVERRTMFAEDVVNMLRRDVQVRIERGWSGGRAGAFHVSFQGRNAVQTAVVVNRVANLFIEANLKSREVQANGTSEFLDAQLKEAKARLDTQEELVSRYKVAHTGELPQQENSLIGTLASLQGQLEANRDAMNRAEQSMAIIENALSMAQSAEQARQNFVASARTQAAQGRRGAGDVPALAGMAETPAQKQSVLVSQELAEARMKYSNEHPEVRRLERNLATLLQMEAAAVPAPRTTVRQNTESAKNAAPQSEHPEVIQDAEALHAGERIASLESQLRLAKAELDTRKSDQQYLQTRIASFQEHIERLPVREQEMARITRDYEISKLNYKSLLDKKLAADMASDMERGQKSERYTLTDPARTPERPVMPNRPLLNLLGCLAGLVLGLATAIGMELRKGSILGEWELPQGIQVLATLPLIHVMPGQAHSGPPSFKHKRKLTIGLASATVIAVVALVIRFSKQV